MAWMTILLLVPIMLVVIPFVSESDLSFVPLVEYLNFFTTTGGTILVATWVVVGAMLWSLGRVLIGEAEALIDNPIWGSYWYFDTEAREAKGSLWLMWLAALLDGLLLLPRMIALVVIAICGMITLSFGVVASILAFIVPIIVAVAILWWVGCAFFITCS